MQGKIVRWRGVSEADGERGSGETADDRDDAQDAAVEMGSLASRGLHEPRTAEPASKVKTKVLYKPYVR